MREAGIVMKLPSAISQKPSTIRDLSFESSTSGDNATSVARQLGQIGPSCASCSFTHPDTLTSHLLATRPDLTAHCRDRHGQVFTSTGFKDLVARIGLPLRRRPRAWGALSDGFIEAQRRDDGPVSRFITHAACDPAAAAASP